MSRKILRRCSNCQKFHASYLVPDEKNQPEYLCYDCWQKRFGTAGKPDMNNVPGEKEQKTTNLNQERESEK